MNQTPLNRSRNDKFNLILELPVVLRKQYDPVLKQSNSADSVQFMVYGSPTPSLSVPAITVPYAGQNYKTSSASRPSYPPLVLTFIIDNGYKNYWMLYKWLNLFNDAKDSSSELANVGGTHFVEDRGLQNPMNDLAANFYMFALDEYNKNIVKFVYKQAFLTSIGEINYSHQDAAEITCRATFEYNQFDAELIKNIDEITCS